MKSKYVNVIKTKRTRAREVVCFDWQVDASMRIPIYQVSTPQATTFCLWDVDSYAPVSDPDFAIELSSPYQPT